MRTEALAGSTEQPIPPESVAAKNNYSVPDYRSSRIVGGLRVVIVIEIVMEAQVFITGYDEFPFL